MKKSILALSLSIAVYGQFEQQSDATKLATVIQANTAPPIKLVDISPIKVSQKQKHWWYASQASLAAANVLDVHSSWGKYELNPVLKSSDGRFGTKGVLLKAAIVGGLVGYQHLVYHKILRKEEDKKRFIKAATIANFCLTGVFTGVAIHNYQIPSPVDSAVRRLIVIQ